MLRATLKELACKLFIHYNNKVTLINKQLL